MTGHATFLDAKTFDRNMAFVLKTHTTFFAHRAYGQTTILAFHNPTDFFPEYKIILIHGHAYAYTLIGSVEGKDKTMLRIVVETSNR